LKKLTTKDFETCYLALDFIDEIKKKNTKCDGKLTVTSKGKKIEELKYTWHVTYNADLINTKDLKAQGRKT
jgi:hypothetical protein